MGSHKSIQRLNRKQNTNVKFVKDRTTVSNRYKTILRAQLRQLRERFIQNFVRSQTQIPTYSRNNNSSQTRVRNDMSEHVEPHIIQRTRPKCWYTGISRARTALGSFHDTGYPVVGAILSPTLAV